MLIMNDCINLQRAAVAVVALIFFFSHLQVSCVRLKHICRNKYDPSSVAFYRYHSVTEINVFLPPSFLIMFAVVDFFVISGTKKKKAKTSDTIVYLCATTAPQLPLP